jgi:hypothetical protein
MSDIEFKDKFIGFVDILGFKELVENSEAGTGKTLTQILELLKFLGSPEDQAHFTTYAPSTCPESTSVQRDLNFRITQISNCVVVSSEVSPAGVINLISHCWDAVTNLLAKGVLCRGYITRGSVFHTETQFVGSGYQKACKQEKNVSAFRREDEKVGTPFVEVDQIVCDYVRDCGDSYVKEMFSRCVKGDSVVTALFPFKRLAHSFIIAGLGPAFNPEDEKQSNQNLRSIIENYKKLIIPFLNHSNPDVVRKVEHYITALDQQLHVCEETNDMIDVLGELAEKKRILPVSDS